MNISLLPFEILIVCVLCVGLCCVVGIPRAKEITSWISTGGRTERKRGRCCERNDIIYKSSAERPTKLLAFLSGETTEATVCLLLREKVT